MSEARRIKVEFLMNGRERKQLDALAERTHLSRGALIRRALQMVAGQVAEIRRLGVEPRTGWRD